MSIEMIITFPFQSKLLELDHMLKFMHGQICEKIDCKLYAPNSCQQCTTLFRSFQGNQRQYTYITYRHTYKLLKIKHITKTTPNYMLKWVQGQFSENVPALCSQTPASVHVLHMYVHMHVLQKRVACRKEE